MFESITDLAGKLAATGYFIDPVMIKVVYLAVQDAEAALARRAGGVRQDAISRFRSPRPQGRISNGCNATGA